MLLNDGDGDFQATISARSALAKATIPRVRWPWLERLSEAPKIVATPKTRASFRPNAAIPRG